MSSFEFTSIPKELEERQSSESGQLPSDCYTLAWTKEKGKAPGPFYVDPIVVYNPKTKFKDKPIILLPCKPQLDERKIELHMLPVNTKPEPRSELLSAEALTLFETHAKRILDWSKNAQTILSQPNPDAKALASLAFDCTKGEVSENVEELRKSILGTVVPRNMPQLVEPWQDVKDNTRQAVNSLPLIAQALADKKQSEANRLLQSVVDGLNQALGDGFDRASAVADRLPKLQRGQEISVNNDLSPDDQRKSAQIKILGAYQTLSYYVGKIESEVRTLSDRLYTYGGMEESDWDRLETNYKALQRDLKGLKSEFNEDTMKTLEASNELTGEQNHVLTQFRQSLGRALPALESLQTTSPIQGRKFTPVNDGLAEHMSDIQSLCWKITGKADELRTELALKKEIPTAPAWKRPLLEQKLVLWKQLDDPEKNRAVTVSTIKDLDNEIHARTLEETTPSSLRPLVNQYNSYDEFSRISDAIDDISRDARDVLFLTGGYYSKNEIVTRLQKESTSLLSTISNFKNKVSSAERQAKLSSMINSTDLMPQQSAQLKEFYNSVQSLIPQVEQLENDVRMGAGKNFWKLSKVVREQLEAAHRLGFEITLAGYKLHGQLNKELEGKK